MLSDTELREAMRDCLSRYDDALSSGKPEQEVDAWIIRLEALVPHSKVSDLVFWGERERTQDEVIEEAVHREKIWRSGGELALLLHLEAQLSHALSEPDLPLPCSHYSEKELTRIRQQIAEIAGHQKH